MNKKDLKLIGFIAVFAILLYGGLRFYQATQTSKEMGTVQRSYRDHDEVILTFDLNVNDTYTFEGAYGEMHLEVKDKKFRLINVECPNHTCEQQGWIDAESIIPIVCLPNQVIVSASNN